MKDRTTPYQRLRIANHETDRHNRHPMGHGRYYLILLDFRLCFYPKHGRNGRTVDIGVHDSNLRTHFHQCRSKIHRYRALADPAFTASHQKNMFDIRKHIFRFPARTSLRIKRNLHFTDPVDRQKVFFRFSLHHIFHETYRGSQNEAEADLLTLNLKVLHETKADDIPVEIGIDNLTQSFEYFRFTDSAHKKKLLR